MGSITGIIVMAVDNRFLRTRDGGGGGRTYFTYDNYRQTRDPYGRATFPGVFSRGVPVFGVRAKLIVCVRTGVSCVYTLYLYR